MWQNAATPASDVTNGVDYFGASGTTNWSLSGSGPVGTYQFGHGHLQRRVYGNSGSGTTSASGAGSNSYDYQEFFSYSPASGGAWTPQSGSGSASGYGLARLQLLGQRRLLGRWTVTWVFVAAGCGEWPGLSAEIPTATAARSIPPVPPRGLRLLDQVHLHDYQRPVDH